MAKYLEDWLDTDVAEAEKLSIGQLSNQFFFRDPTRPNYIDYEHFYSPADGTILYQKFIEDPTEPIVEIKGINYHYKMLCVIKPIINLHWLLVYLCRFMMFTSIAYPMEVFYHINL